MWPRPKGAINRKGRSARTVNLTHLVGLDQVEVLPVNTEAMFKVPALFLTPGTEPVCKERGGAQAAGGSRDKGEPRAAAHL